MHDPMMDLDPNIVTDENGTPVAVQIPYADWLRLEGYLAAVTEHTDASPEEAGPEEAQSEKDESASARSPSAPSPADSPLDPERSSVGGQLDELLRTRSSKEQRMQQRLQQEWEHMDDEAPESPSNAGADIDDAFDQALEEARGTWDRDDADYERALREEWDQL